MADILSPALEDIGAQLEATSVHARRIIGNLSPKGAGRRPNPTSWSVAECLAHLTLTTDAYLPPMREALAEGRRQTLPVTPSSFRMEVPARLLAWWLEPPYRFKSRTLPAFVPGSEDPASALPDFLERQQQLFQLLTEANGLALDRLRIASPFARQMHYSVYSAFRLIAIHQRRHLWQAEKIVRLLGAERD